MKVIRYVVGFLFDEARQVVVLIEKAKPAFMAGLYNGVGGKIEEGETEAEAMSREFAEEAGSIVLPEEWQEFVRLRGADYEVVCFRAFGVPRLCRTMTDEPIQTFLVKSIPHQVMPNVPWLIQMALCDEVVEGRYVVSNEATAVNPVTGEKSVGPLKKGN